MHGARGFSAPILSSTGPVLYFRAILRCEPNVSMPRQRRSGVMHVRLPVSTW